jgi:hypothetical protein
VWADNVGIGVVEAMLRPYDPHNFTRKGQSMIESSRRSGITLTDLVVAVVCVVLIGVTALAWAAEENETDRRIKCAANLRQIGQAMLLYANENRTQWPRTHYNQDLQAHPLTAFTVPEADHAIAIDKQTKKPLAGQKGDGGAPAYNDVTAALFLLIRTLEIGSEVFVCGSSGMRPDRFGADGRQVVDEPWRKRSNFSSPKHLSYSVATPYPAEHSTAKGYKWDANRSPEFVVAADLNPGLSGENITAADFVHTAPAERLRRGNSTNHNREGQNVLCGDGHVEWVETPFAGVNRDNIYTQSQSTENPNETTSSEVFDGTMTPAGAGDSILLPIVEGGSRRGKLGRN